MKRLIPCFLIVSLLCGCSFLGSEPATTPQTEAPTIPETLTVIPTEEELPPETEPETEPETLSEHSALYIPDLAVEDVIVYFNEVCLATEYATEGGGDASLVQKWVTPIYYRLYDEYTDEDVTLIEQFAAELNALEGFPGMYPAEYEDQANLTISFWNQDRLTEELGYVVNNEISDGIVHFWYNGDNELFDEEIGIRSDLSQYKRNPVILEEIYNGLGPVQDTVLREDSLIYQYYTIPEGLTEVDWLILKLLYHPDIRCGMDAAACEQVIRSLYY